MKRLIHLIYLPLLLHSLSSCQQELDFEFHDAEPQLVIESTLGADGACVSLMHTTPIAANQIDTTRLTDASVTLVDLTAGTSVALSATPDGTFRSSLPGITGHDYRLDITRQGRSYSSSATMLPAARSLDMRFGWVNMAGVNVLMMQFAIGANPDQVLEYWLRVYRNGQPLYWQFGCGHVAQNGIIPLAVMAAIDEDDSEMQAEMNKRGLHEGDTITATLTPISIQMSDYLQALQHNSNGQPFYSGSPCLGYFYASPTLTRTQIFHLPPPPNP